MNSKSSKVNKMVNLKSSENNSTTRKMCTRGSVKSENSLEKHIPKLPVRRTSPSSQGNQPENLTRVTRQNQTYRETVKTNKENTADKKKKVNKSELKTVNERKNQVNSPDNKGTSEKKQAEPLNQQTKLKNSPTHGLCDEFSGLQVNDNLKNKQIENEKKLKLAKKNLKWKSKSESELSIDDDVSEYFQIRRSERKESKYVYYEKQKDLENKIIRKVKDGLEIKNFDEKGRGIVTTKKFYKGDFVIEYIGDLIDMTTAKQREFKYSKNKKLGCYMYYFKHKDVQWCIDATKESGELGRLINHSRKGNLISKIIEVGGKPHLIFFANTEISVGTELLYDYGDRSKESLKHHPWLVL